MNLYKSGVATFFGILLLGVSSASVSALPVTGQVNIAGSVGVTGTLIDFYGGDAFCTLPGAGGCFDIKVPLTGDFSTLVVGPNGGSIQDLQGPPISGTLPVPIVGFMVFNNGITFDLKRVAPGGGVDCATINPNAPNVSCTPRIFFGPNPEDFELSPFRLVNSDDGQSATIFFNISGDAYLGSTGTGFSTFLGAFSTQTAGKNIADILADVANGTPIVASYSANFTTSPIPEPDSKILLGIGMIALLLGGLRTKQRSDSN